MLALHLKHSDGIHFNQNILRKPAHFNRGPRGRRIPEKLSAIAFHDHLPYLVTLENTFILTSREEGDGKAGHQDRIGS